MPGLAACESYQSLEEDGVTRDGVMPLQKVRIGLADGALQDASVTFVRDVSAVANVGGKRQYLSRERTPGGGQYVIQCLDGACYAITILYLTAIAKDPAFELSKTLLPADAPPLARMDDSGMKSANPSDWHENYYYGEEYLVTLDFADKKGTLVKSINAMQLSTLKTMSQRAEEDKKARQPLVEAAQKAEAAKR